MNKSNFHVLTIFKNDIQFLNAWPIGTFFAIYNKFKGWRKESKKTKRKRWGY